LDSSTIQVTKISLRYLCVLPALGPFKSIEVLSNNSLVGLSKKNKQQKFKKLVWWGSCCFFIEKA
jgi:hypothetical protein